MTRAGVLILAGALIAAGVAAASPSQSRIVDGQFHSKAIDAALHYEVYLPADYTTSAQAYPVIKRNAHALRNLLNLGAVDPLSVDFLKGLGSKQLQNRAECQRASSQSTG